MFEQYLKGFFKLYAEVPYYVNIVYKLLVIKFKINMKGLKRYKLLKNIIFHIIRRIIIMSNLFPFITVYPFFLFFHLIHSIFIVKIQIFTQL